MKKNFSSTDLGLLAGDRPGLVGLFIVLAWLCIPPCLQSQTLTWDNAPGTPGLQNGSGTWNTTLNNWLDSTNANVLWTNNGSEIAHFGSTTPVATNNVSISGNMTLKGINFLALGTGTPVAGQQYALNGAAAGTILNFGDSGLIQFADFSSGGSQFVALGANLELQGSNLTLQKSGGTATQFINLNMASNPNLTGMLTIGSYVYVGIGALGTISKVSGITVKTNGTLVLGAPGDYPMAITASGYTNTYAAIRVTGSNVTLSGGITMTGTTGILMHSGNTGLLINKPITATDPAYGLQRSALTKTDGVMTLAAANTYGGTTMLGRAAAGYAGGVTVLDFAAATSPQDDILYNGLTTPGALDLIGANTGSSMLVLNGKAAAVNSQRLGNVNVQGFRSSVELISGAGGTMNLSVGTITRTTTGMLALTAPAQGGISTTMSDAFLGPWATYKSGAGLASWAQVSGNVITGFSGTTPHATGEATASSATTHLAVGSVSTGSVTPTGATSHLATVSMADPFVDRTVLTGSGNTLRLGVSGGVQVVSNAKSLTIGQLGISSSLSAGGAATGTGQLFLTNNSATSLLTVHSGITNNVSGGVVSLFVNGATDSTTVLTGTGSFTGGTTIASGALELRNGAALGTTGTITVIEGGSLRFSGGITVNRAVTATGIGTSLAMEGALRNVSGNNIVSGAITLAGTTSITSDAGTLTIQAATAATAALSGAFNLVLGGRGDIAVNGRIATTTATLTKTGNGTLTLSGDNNFTGAITVSGGVLRPTHANALGVLSGSFGTTAISSGAALEMLGGITLAAEPLTISSVGVNGNGGIRNVSGNNTITGLITLGGVTTIRIQSDSGKLTFDTASGASIQQTATTARILVLAGAGAIDVLDPITRTSTGTLTLQKEGNGTVTLAAAVGNTHTTVNGGTLNLDFSAATSPTSNILHNGIATPNELTMNSGTLLITGKSGTSNSQAFGPVVPTGVNTANGGSSYLTVAQNGATRVDLSFGAFTRGLGGVLGITRPTTGNLTTTGGADNSIFISALGTPYMWSIDSVNGDEWLGSNAISSGSRQILPLSALPSGGYTSSTASSLTGNADIASGVTTTTLAAATAVTSLRFAQPQTTEIKQDASARVLTVGGILVSSTVGNFTQTISTATLKAPESGAANDLPIIQNNTAAPLIINSIIPNQTTGSFATTLTKAGPGTLILKGASTYTGSTRVHEGVLHFQGGSISSNTEFLLGSGDKSGKVVLGVGSTAYNTTVDWLQVMGTGTDNRIVGGASVVSTLMVDNVTTNNNFRAGFLGGPGVNENNLAFSVNDVATTTVTTMFLPLGGANTYGGLTQIRNATVEASVLADRGSASSLGTGDLNDLIEMGSGGNTTVLNIIAAIRYVGAADSSTNRPLQIANSIATVQSVTTVLENNGVGSLKFTAPFTSTGTNTTATRILRLSGTNTGGNEIVSITDNGARPTALEKTGVGTWIITGDSTHTGGTTISSGTLQLGKGGTTGSVAGTAITLSSATSVLGTSRSDSLMMNQSITGSGSLKVSNGPTGATKLTGSANTWTGGTTVSGGILLANNTTVDSSATGTGPVYIGPGATLGGTGRIAPAANNSITIVAGTLQIGDSTLVTPVAANLTLHTSGTGSLSILAGSAIAFDLFSVGGDNTGNAAAADRLTTLGAVVLGTDAVLRVNANGLTGFAEGDSWKLFDWSSLTVTGSFSDTELPSLSGDLFWDMDDLYTTGVLRVAYIVPEPGRVGLLSLGVAFLGLRRTRRRA